MRVLIVEDNFLLREEVAELVEQAGDEVVGPFEDASEATAACQRTPPDYALLDLQLRDHTSLPTAEFLKMREIPFAFLTAYGRDFLPEIFAKVPLIAKPIQPQVVTEFLNVRREGLAKRIR